jgi:hypothetical protein
MKWGWALMTKLVTTSETLYAGPHSNWQENSLVAPGGAEPSELDY